MLRIRRIPVWTCCTSGSGILAALAANPAGNPGIRARRKTVPRPPQLHETAANPGKSGHLSRRPPERVFSILNDTFDDDQESAKADYMEYSLMRQFNQRGRAK